MRSRAVPAISRAASCSKAMQSVYALVSLLTSAVVLGLLAECRCCRSVKVVGGLLLFLSGAVVLWVVRCLREGYAFHVQKGGQLVSVALHASALHAQQQRVEIQRLQQQQLQVNGSL